MARDGFLIQMPENPQERDAARTPLAAWIALALVLVALPWLRQRWLDVPLDRDEGEYAYIGRLLLHGVPPYSQAYNMKLPGIYAAYAAVLWLFGETTRGIHAGLVLVNALTALAAFLLGRRLLGAWAGVAAAAAFGILSLSIGVQGPSANSEHFVLLPAVLGLWLVLRGVERERPPSLLAGGLCLGLAFLVKQHGFAFALFGALFVAAHEVRRRPRAAGRSAGRVALFALALALPYLLACLWLWSAGVFGRFWLWTFEYARAYASQRPLAEGVKNLWAKGSHVVRFTPALWALVAVGLSALAWDRRVRGRAAFLGGLALASLLAIVPGMIFRPHYFLLALPAAALLVAAACVGVARAVRRVAPTAVACAVPALLLAGALGDGLWRHWSVLFHAPPDLLSKWMLGDSNPFAESSAVASFVRERTEPGDSIAIVGSEPQIYFYARRPAATGYVYTYALMEDHPFAHAMQLDMIDQIEQARPEMLLLVKLGLSWLMNERSDTTILAWVDRYTRENYDLVGLMRVDAAQWRLYHGAALRSLAERPREAIEIYQRRR